MTAFKSKYADRNNIDLGGRTITIANQKWWKASGSNLFMDRIAENIDYFEDLWNFKLEYVYPAGANDEYHQKLSTSVLSGEPGSGYRLGGLYLPVPRFHGQRRDTERQRSERV